MMKRSKPVLSTVTGRRVTWPQIRMDRRGLDDKGVILIEDKIIVIYVSQDCGTLSKQDRGWSHTCWSSFAFGRTDSTRVTRVLRGGRESQQQQVNPISVSDGASGTTAGVDGDRLLSLWDDVL